jgi:hypothetical protein
MIADAEPFALAGIVITEILQGLRRDVSRIERYLSQWEMLEAKGFSRYREAAGIFSGRPCAAGQPPRRCRGQLAAPMVTCEAVIPALPFQPRFLLL